MKRRTITIVTGMALGLLLALSSVFTAYAQGTQKIINLPNAWLPEGVVTGNGPVIYSGSRANGAIYAADLITGEGRILVPGVEGRVAVGLSYDSRSNYIYAAGGPGGGAFVYDAASGAEVGAFQFVTDGNGTFVNDVIVTNDGAYFTDSQRPVLYRIPLGPAGALPADGAFEVIPLSGDFEQVQGFNANGIEATANGDSLILVHSTLGKLYDVDPRTGTASEIDLNGYSVTMGDGLLRQGNYLYVVRNRINLIVKIRLSQDLSSGKVVGLITDPAFDVPTTVAGFGNDLFAVNARFGTPNTPETTYTIVRVSR